jgi:hypothetical protein
MLKNIRTSWNITWIEQLDEIHPIRPAKKIFWPIPPSWSLKCITAHTILWSRDKRLRDVAETLGLKMSA